MVIIDLRGRGRLAAAGLLLLLVVAILLRGAGQAVRLAREALAPPPAAIRKVARPDRVVALTFDAAFGVEDAPAIVEALAKAGLPATFFVTGGWLERQAGLAARLPALGCEVGNATFSYLHLDVLGPEGLREELRRTEALIQRHTKKKPELFRPPFGEESPETLAIAHEQGYRTVLWTVDTLDWRNPSPGFIAARVERHLAPGTIFRFSTAGRHTAAALPEIARLLARRGYRAVRLSDLLLREDSYVDGRTGEQRPLPGTRPGERPVLVDWWRRWRVGVRPGVTLAGRPMAGLLPEEVRREVEELARQVDRPAVPARWDPAGGVVRPERPGQRLNVPETVRAVLEADRNTAVQPLVSPIAPAVVSGMFNAVYQGRPDGRRAALMFNVSWGNEVLPQLLAELDRAKVKATFFVEGRWAERFPDLLRSIGERGHCLGSHAYRHVDPSKLPAGELVRSLAMTREAVQRGGFRLAPLFAPPAGAFSPEVVRTAAAEGYWTILWSADSIDWQRPAPSVIIERVLRKISPGGLVLLHPTEPTVQALPGLISALRNLGYELVTVPELLPGFPGPDQRRGEAS